MQLTQKKISAIIACYKDAEAIPVMAEELRLVFERINVDYEMIFVNDGSPDNSQEVLEQLAAQNKKLKAITHSRNFGSQNAFTSGLMKATGDACVLLDGDLQDPPALIEAFNSKWKEGYDVVYGVRVKRELPAFWGIFYKGFYRLFQKLAYVPVPVDAGDFSLIDRKVVTALLRLEEKDRFLRGLRAWVGFKQTGVPYLRPERRFGKSTNNLWSNIRWAKKAIFAFSYVPLELISILAFFVSVTSVLVIIWHLIDRFFRPELPPGISTVLVIALILGAIQLLSLAFIAEYITKIFEEVKGRPHFIVTKELNFES